MSRIFAQGAAFSFAFESIVRLIGRGHPDDCHPGMRLGAYPGSLQIETPFAIPDTTQASFRDDKNFA